MTVPSVPVRAPSAKCYQASRIPPAFRAPSLRRTKARSHSDRTVSRLSQLHRPTALVVLHKGGPVLGSSAAPLYRNSYRPITPERGLSPPAATRSKYSCTTVLHLAISQSHGQKTCTVFVPIEPAEPNWPTLVNLCQ
jgi:hypothetical protein